MKELKLYWSRSKPNFGDAMSPMICERLAGCKVVYASRRRCDLVAQGSLLHRFRERFFHRRIHVWGTGFIEACPARHSRFYYDAVRGRHSAALIQGPTIGTFGDPGLLADVLWPELKKTAKRHRVGLMPHYEDRADPRTQTLANALRGCTVIDVFGDVTEVLRQIASCECVLSSSLHGLIVADAFGVPNAWIKLSQKIRGDDFKFRDYYSVFGLDARINALAPEQIDDKAVERIIAAHDRPELERVKQQLIEAFPFRR